MYSRHLKKIKGKGFSISKFIIDSSPKTSLFPKRHLKKIKGKGFSISKFIIDSLPKLSLFPKTNNKAHKINE